MEDREKVINCLTDIENILIVRQDICPREELQYWIELQEGVADALAMLKEREEVVPYIDIDEAKCPICKVKLTRQELLGDDVLFEDFFDYCSRCGRKVKWQ